MVFGKGWRWLGEKRAERIEPCFFLGRVAPSLPPFIDFVITALHSSVLV